VIETAILGRKTVLKLPKRRGFWLAHAPLCTPSVYMRQGDKRRTFCT
jgi:hypothetical protein